MRAAADEEYELRAHLRDLSALLALPTLWRDKEAAYVASSLLDVLVGMLRLDVAYVRVGDDGGPGFEDWRPSACARPEIQAVEASAPASDETRPAVLTLPVRSDPYRVAVLRLDLRDSSCLVVAGSRRAGFPDDVERFVLIAAAEQARIVLNRARTLAAEQAARLQAEQAVRARDEILAVVTHDLKNPLTIIRTSAQILRRLLAPISGGRPEQVMKAVEHIDNAAATVDQLLNALLDAARLQIGEPLHLNVERTDLVQLVREVVDEERQIGSSHRIVVNSSVDELVGFWDRVGLERVVENPLANALKYSPDESPIEIVVEREIESERQQASLTFTDHGVGVPEADLPHIFEPFYRGATCSWERPEPGWDWQACATSSSSTGARYRW